MTYSAAERTYGAFQRSFTLPEGIDGEHVIAELREGVLTALGLRRCCVSPRRRRHAFKERHFDASWPFASMEVFQTNIRTASTCSCVSPGTVILVLGSTFFGSRIQRRAKP